MLAFCFGSPVMAVDRHVERVSKRIGLLPPKANPDQSHDLYLGLLQPDEMYAAHVLLIHHGRAICHAQNPKHDLCPVARPLPLRRPQGALTGARAPRIWRTPWPSFTTRSTSSCRPTSPRRRSPPRASA